MKVKIDKDDMLVYVLSTGHFGLEVGVDKRKVNRWKAVAKEFYKMQGEMEKVYEAV